MIKATIIQDSIANGIRITTFELEYPRFIHAELMTHRQFSRNAASSRAIPVEKMLDHIAEFPAEPYVWSKNMPGMQAKENLIGGPLFMAKEAWSKAVYTAVEASRDMLEAGLHKQYTNRNTEFAQTMKTVLTATEYDNWYWLRDHTDAQPDIHQLAHCMKEAHKASKPMELMAGEWHVPYVDRHRWSSISPVLYSINGEQLSAEDARIISASCCAQVSYRKSDDSLEKAKVIFDRLINSVPCHASPVEHQASPMMFVQHLSSGDIWEEGITHMQRNGTLWSGNFRGWIQFRQLIPNNSR